MGIRDKVLRILALDFAILVAIVGGWVLFVLGDGGHFRDLLLEANLVKLTVAVVAWLVLYAQHIRVAGDFTPPEPAIADVAWKPGAPTAIPATQTPDPPIA